MCNSYFLVSSRGTVSSCACCMGLLCKNAARAFSAVYVTLITSEWTTGPLSLRLYCATEVEVVTDATCI